MQPIAFICNYYAGACTALGTITLDAQNNLNLNLFSGSVRLSALRGTTV